MITDRLINRIGHSPLVLNLVVSAAGPESNDRGRGVARLLDALDIAADLLRCGVAVGTEGREARRTQWRVVAIVEPGNAALQQHPSGPNPCNNPVHNNAGRSP